MKSLPSLLLALSGLGLVPGLAVPPPAQTPASTSAAPAANAPAGEPSVPVGELVEKVATQADPAQTYTLYLPPGYDAAEGVEKTSKRWPALLIFDPRGRGTVAAERFRAGAERYGWILMSSDNTASDGEMGPNLEAVQAMLPDLLHRWAVDPHRVYATGMSGTSVVAWVLARQPGALAGVIAAAGPRSEQLFDGITNVGFAHFGTTGTGDFNFTEMRAMDDLLAGLGAPHRLAIFDGPHGWMPPELATRAIGWLEVQAMRYGLRPIDDEVIRSVFQTELEDVRAEEAGGDLYQALRGYRELASGFEGLGMVGKSLQEARTKIETLAADPRELRQEKEIAAWDLEEARNRQRLGEVQAGLMSNAHPGMGDRPWTAERILDALKIETVLKQAQGEGYGAGAARRMLATITTQLTFYLRRQLWNRKAWREAAWVLEAATSIHPDRADLWYDLACARALEGHKKPALAALETALEKGYADRAHLETDEDLKALRGMEEFRGLVERLPAGAVPEAGAAPDSGAR